MRRRRAIRTAASAVVLVVLAYAAASAYVWNTLTSVTGDCPPSWRANDPTSFEVEHRPEFDTTPYALPAPEDVRFPSRDPQIEVSGWWIPAADPDAPAVILVHGHTACKRDHAVLLPGGMLHRNGFSVLLIDLRDHGDSTLEDGRFAGGTDEYRDVLGAWDWLQAEQGMPAARIGLLGVSLGAATVLIATGEEPGVAATWEDSSYADISVAIRAELSRNGYPEFLETGGVAMARLLSGDDLAGLSPLGGVRSLDGRPLFVTHGEEDGRLSVEYGRQLVAAVEADGGDVEAWFVPGSGHTEAMVLVPDEYEERLVGFFRRTIAP